MARKIQDLIIVQYLGYFKPKFTNHPLYNKTEGEKEIKDQMNDLIEKGYEPLGGVCITEVIDESVFFNQTMVLYEK